MSNAIVEKLVDAQEEIYRLTGEVLVLCAKVSDEDFDLIYAEYLRRPKPYLYIKSFEFNVNGGRICIMRQTATIV
jgi:hypothetical protein